MRIQYTISKDSPNNVRIEIKDSENNNKESFPITNYCNSWEDLEKEQELVNYIFTTQNIFKPPASLFSYRYNETEKILE
ncbi:MAG: hypothetical protein SV062_05565 [Thermodesulfobacteriota bacterium]|nr:hypothetical protein [Thermodesulfobacteriota bacterium]